MNMMLSYEEPRRNSIISMEHDSRAGAISEKQAEGKHVQYGKKHTYMLKTTHFVL